MIPVILDVDTGSDDALALAYAVASPELDLVAVSTVAGNIDVTKATANTLAVLDWLGAADVPVHQGASHPLVRPHQDAAYFHHEGGLGGARLPISTRQIGKDRGPAAMIRLARQRPGEITLVALGPLTNLAIALNVEPALTSLVKSVVIMGGAFTVPGNTTASAEFNILVDPEAAAQVFAAPWIELIAVGLDVTEQVALTGRDWQEAQQPPALPPTAALFAEVGRFAFQTLGRDRFALHDPLAVAVARNPGLVEVEEARVEVETSGEEVGRTRIFVPVRTLVEVWVDAERALADFRDTVRLVG